VQLYLRIRDLRLVELIELLEDEDFDYDSEVRVCVVCMCVHETYNICDMWRVLTPSPLGFISDCM
jgi:hypothetical protein